MSKTCGGHLIQMTIMWVLELNLGPVDFEIGLLCNPGWLYEVLYVAEAGLELMFLLHLLPKCCG